MTIEIENAFAERLATGHRAESARRREMDASDARPSEGAQSLEALIHPLREAVLHYCPSVRFMQEADTRIARVGPGALMWRWAVPVGPDCWGCEPGLRPVFDVALHAEIGVKMLAGDDAEPGQVNRTGDRGRVHSLWYCDAFEAGRFEWAEIGFVVTKEDGSLFPGEGIAPTARAPGPRVAAALAARGGTLQLGYPFIPLSREDARLEFVERWLGWFADASLGEFQRGMMGSIDPEFGEWRRPG